MIMKRFVITAVAVLLAAIVYAVPAESNFGVGPQYDTTHVYVQPEDFDRFVASLIAPPQPAAHPQTKPVSVQTGSPKSQTHRIASVALFPHGMASQSRHQDAKSS